LNRAEYFQKQKELSKTAVHAEAESIRRIRKVTRELVIPLVRQYAEQGMITFPKEELARQIDHIIREEGAKPVMEARKLQEDMEAFFAEKLGIKIRPRTEPKDNAKQRRFNAAKKPVGEIIVLPGQGWGYGASTKGLAGYYRDPQTGKIVWTDLPLEYQFRKRSDLSTQVWKAVEEQEQMVFDVIQGGRALGRNVKDICGDLEQFINKPNGGEIVVGRWMGMFPNTEAGRMEAWKREYLAAHGGLQPGSEAAKALLRQTDAQAWVKQKMEETTKRGTPRLPSAVKQYATRLGKAGLDYRQIRIARTEMTSFLSDEQKDIAENSLISTGEMDFVMDRGRDHWNCSCEHYAEQNPWKVDDPDRPEIPVHPNCFSGNTKVLTPKGWKAIKKIRVGEYVITSSGKLRTVTSVMALPGDGQLLNFDGVTMTADQTLLTSNGFATLNNADNLLNVFFDMVKVKRFYLNTKNIPTIRHKDTCLCFVLNNFSGSGVIVSAVDLDGCFNIWEGNVDIKLIASVVKNSGIAGMAELVKNNLLIPRARFSLLPCRSFAKVFMASFNIANSIMGIINTNWAGIGNIPTQKRFPSAGDFNPSSPEKPVNLPSAKASLFRNSVHRILQLIEHIKYFFGAVFYFSGWNSASITAIFNKYFFNHFSVYSKFYRDRFLGFYAFGVRPVNGFFDGVTCGLHTDIIHKDKIKYKRYCKCNSRVYDIEIEDEHNFLIKGKRGIYVAHNCMCTWHPRLRTDEEIIAAFKDEMAEDLEIIEGTQEQADMLADIDKAVAVPQYQAEVTRFSPAFNNFCNDMKQRITNTTFDELPENVKQIITDKLKKEKIRMDGKTFMSKIDSIVKEGQLVRHQYVGNFLEHLDEFEKDPRIKSSWETNTTEGFADKACKHIWETQIARLYNEETLVAGDKYPLKKQFEEMIGGTQNRPVYGEVVPKGIEVTEGGASFYGEMHIVMSDNVRNRTTFTFFDSSNGTGSMYENAASSYSKFNKATLNTEGMINLYNRYEGRGKPVNYTEMQIWGGVDLSKNDVKEVVIGKANYDYYIKDSNFRRLKSIFESYNIPIRIVE
jgi:hypothetical protein